MAEQKRKEPTFYRVLHRTDKFNPGEHIELERSVEFDRWNVDRSDLAELVKLPLQELQAKRKDGATAEKTIFGKVQVAAEEWVEQAAQTMLLDRAIEYVKTPEVKHTSNEWKRQKDGVWEISNRVYIMRYKIMQETTGNHQGQWLVTWGIAINRPPRPSTEKYYYSGDVMVPSGGNSSRQNGRTPWPCRTPVSPRSPPPRKPMPGIWKCRGTTRRTAPGTSPWSCSASRRPPSSPPVTAGKR